MHRRSECAVIPECECSRSESAHTGVPHKGHKVEASLASSGQGIFSPVEASITQQHSRVFIMSIIYIVQAATTLCTSGTSACADCLRINALCRSSHAQK